MNFNEYQGLSTRTMPTGCNERATLNYTLGLVGEAGEFAELIKKHIFHGHKLDEDKVIGELGDVLHYLAGLATLHGLTLEEVAQYNINKLKKRYPSGFNSSDSIKRVDVE